MRRLLCLPQRVCDAVENANRGISELRLGITSVLLPLKVLIWISIMVVAFDVLRGTSVHHSIAYRMVVGAIDQLWYTIFYFSVPFLWHRSRLLVEKFSEGREWIVVKDAGVDHEQNPSLRAEICVETTDEEDWVIVDWDEILTPSKKRPL